MFSIIEVRTSQGDLLTLPLDDESSGLIVKGLEGLDPVKATLVTSSFAQLDGEQYHSSRREARNIKIKLGLEPDYAINSVRELRNRIYSFFMPKTEVSLRFIRYESFMSEIFMLDILGRVETCETPLFTEEPEVDISLMCFDPDFYDPVPISINGLSTSGLTETPIVYDGTVETGMVFRLYLDRDLSEFTIYHRPSDGTFRTLDFSAPLIAGDTLTISTIVGAKSVIRTRAGVDTSLLYSLSPQSNWLEFLPGDNYIRVYVEGVEIPFDINYTNKYGGL